MSSFLNIRYKILQILYFICSGLFVHNAIIADNDFPTNAMIEDHRLKNIVYNPDEIFHFTGHYGYHTVIEFSKLEKIESIVMGDSTAWQILPSYNKLFIKPIESNATTNMTISTDKNTYRFTLEAREADNINDPDLVFLVKFLYSDNEDTQIINNINQDIKIDDIPSFEQPEKINFNYHVMGHEDILPIMICDDGSFTYLFFQDKNGTIPAIFYIDDAGYDYTINYRLSKYHKNVIIIEGVYHQFSLKAGKQEGAIYNEGYRAHSPIYFPITKKEYPGLTIVEEPLLEYVI